MDFLDRQGAFCRRNGTNYGEKKERSLAEKDFHISEKYNFRHALSAFERAKSRYSEILPYIRSWSVPCRCNLNKNN